MTKPKEKEAMQMLTVRVPASLVEKLDQLAKDLEELSPLGLGSVSRSTVQRRALERGIEALKEDVAKLKE